MEENLSKHLKRVRAQFWNDATKGYRNSRILGKRTTHHSAEALQLVENLLQINDNFHWFSFPLKHRKLSCALTAQINCRGIRWSNTGPSPGALTRWHRNVVRYSYRRKENTKPVSLLQTANEIFQHSITCDITIWFLSF